MTGHPGMDTELKMSQGVIKPEKEWTEAERQFAEDGLRSGAISQHRHHISRG